MTLDDYLTQFIEGYLFNDLDSMAAIGVPDGKQFGGVAYPMVMTALSGIEILGTLTSPHWQAKHDGPGNFRHFWREYLYKGREAIQRLDAVFYELVRHGLAHSFMTKPMVMVTKSNDDRHLHKSPDNVIYVDALTLATELRTAYEQRMRPRMIGDFRTQMEMRFEHFREQFWQDYEDLKGEISKVPLIMIGPNAPFAGSDVQGRTTVPNSPSAQMIQYSTNVVTKVDPEKP